MPRQASERKWHELSFLDRLYIDAVGMSMLLGAFAELIFKNGKVTLITAIIGAVLGTIIAIISWRKDNPTQNPTSK